MFSLPMEWEIDKLYEGHNFKLWPIQLLFYEESFHVFRCCVIALILTRPPHSLSQSLIGYCLTESTDEEVKWHVTPAQMVVYPMRHAWIQPTETVQLWWKTTQHVYILFISSLIKNKERKKNYTDHFIFRLINVCPDSHNLVFIFKDFNNFIFF